MPIRQLSPEVVRYIAAGEVVERPASVVKELVENAFDAGATGVRIAIQRGGLGAIRVTDDGGGIPADELELAVTRHATSKLATADDLAHVATLGFRGEALASIGAVSHLEIVSRPPDAATGARLRMVGGEITDQGATGGPAGTTITVRNLFYNVPVRAAFQKSPTTEARHIITALGALALVRPDIALSLTNNGRDALQSPGTGDLLDAIAAVYGPEVAGRLVPLPALDERGRAVSGFTALPDEHRANRQYLAFLVNGRWVRSPFLAHAVAEAYRAMLPGGRHPVAVIRLDVPPEDVDVNVHPTKAEVRLRNERLVYGLVQRAIREALTAQDRATVPQWAGWSPEQTPTVGAAGGGQAAPPGPLSPMQRGGEGAAAPFGAALASAAGAVRTEATADEEPPLLPDEAAHQDRLQVLGQIAKTYIVAVGGTGLYLIDQHSAHERVLYEQLLREAADPVASGERNRQLLLAPEVVSMSPTQHAWLEEHGEVLAELGFGLEPFGGQSWLVRAVPATLAQVSHTGTIAEVIDGALGREYGDGPMADRTRWSVACHGAVKAGDALTAAEMAEIIRQLEACDLGRTCPHGRPTMIHLSQDQLAREFGRH
ncbi:MAG: DNA mismatch repair endonuclease MutL [Chloroflexota bacterium]|nr:DNA mismatch repair endonuclease MutL [Chloroflexota bacterium]